MKDMKKWNVESLTNVSEGLTRGVFIIMIENIQSRLKPSRCNIYQNFKYNYLCIPCLGSFNDFSH